MSVPEDHRPLSRPLPITAKEFDRRAEEGEDMDEYFDWENAASVEPGELSPGQKDAMLTVFRELSPTNKIALVQTMLDAMTNLDTHLDVPIPASLHFELARMALQRQTTREALVQSWIVERLEAQKTAA